MAKKKLELTKLGRYKILSELGRGAMGVVYKGEDPALDRTVALKTVILSADAEGKTEYQKRFFLEAKAAGRLSHPQIITVYDFGQEGDIAYMAMEFLKGKELRGHHGHESQHRSRRAKNPPHEVFLLEWSCPRVHSPGLLWSGTNPIRIRHWRGQ